MSYPNSAPVGFQFDILRFLPESMDDIDFSLSDSEMSDACAKLEVEEVIAGVTVDIIIFSKTMPG